MTEFIARLKQRKLVQWALAYIAFAFALLQGVDVVAHQFGWPDGLQRGITLVLIIGFVVVLVLAWYHGERGAQKVSSTEIVILALLLAIGGGLLWRFERATPATGSLRAASSPDAAERNPGATPSAIPIAAIPAKSIAVLPFENLSGDKNNAYFADGMQDLILTKLADIGDLKVISRTSTAKYQSHPDNLKTIAQQLGVAAILEGSVQKAGNQVLINVQLIDARSDKQVAWIDACLGRNKDAIAAARRASEVMSISRDAYFGEYTLAGLAEVEAHAGAKEQALVLIEKLLAMSAGEVMSVTRLKLDPVWDPLRSDPRFQLLLKKYAGAQPMAATSGASP